MNHEHLVKEWLEECQSKMVIRVWRKQHATYRKVYFEYPGSNAAKLALANWKGQTTVLSAWLISWLLGKGMSIEAVNSKASEMLDYMRSPHFPYAD